MYIRRRLLVLAGLLAVIAVIVLLFVKPGSGGPPDAQEVTVPEGLQTSAPGDDDEGEVPECAPGQLEVTPITDKSDYAAGELPALALSVENTGEGACTADLGTAGMELVVSSGEDEVWRSMDCQESPESLPAILDPGKPVESEPVSWDRTRSSAETCTITREPVNAGGASYHLRVAAAGTPGTGTKQFLLN